MSRTCSLLGPILVTGATGQVGWELVRNLQAFGEVHAPSREQMDMAEPDSIRRAMRRLKPCWVVNAAAYTAVDQAESEIEKAYAINGVAPGVLGEEALRLGAAVLHYSTDYVYSGEGIQHYKESHLPSPLGVYGTSKLSGEMALACSGAAHIILRTSWVYGARGRNFLLTILRAAREQPRLTVVDDQHGAPTWSRDLARLTATILMRAPVAEAARSFQGIYHATATGDTTWYGFAKRALELQMALNPTAYSADIIPVSSSEWPTAARRPTNSRLDCTKLLKTFGFEFPRWEQSLEEVLREIRGAPETGSTT